MSRFQSLHTPTSPTTSNQPMTTSQSMTSSGSIPTNSRWKEPEGQNNPFRTRRFSRERSNGEDNERRTGRGFEAFSSRSSEKRRSPPAQNTRWKNYEAATDERTNNDERRQSRSFRRNNFQKGRYRGERRSSRGSFRPPPKPVFKLENNDFPPLGASAATTTTTTSGPSVESDVSSPVKIGGAFKMDFKRIAEESKDLPAPKHISKPVDRMPRSKPKYEDDEDHEWNTDDEYAARAEDPSDDESFPAKGGYID